MNITEVKIDISEIPKEDWSKMMFSKQDVLRQLYGVPICNLDVPSDQQLLRAMAWNVVEEAGEILDVLMTSGDQDHFFDEVADMTSFYMELLLMSDYRGRFYDWEQIERTETNVEKSFTDFTVSLALTINTLKNRHWRKTNLQTDAITYRERLSNTGPKFTKFIQCLGISYKDFVEVYCKKYRVNLWRLESDY